MRPHGHYCVPIVYLEQVLGVLNLYIREGHVAQFYIEEFLIAYANTLAGIIMRKRTEEELHQTMTNLRKAMEGVIKVTAATVEARDPSLPDINDVFLSWPGPSPRRWDSRQSRLMVSD